MITPKKIAWKTLAGLAVLGLSLALCSCAHNTAPIKQGIANAEMEISDAKDRNAREHAPLELRIAEEKLAKAREALEDEEYDEASYLADEALITAKLAEAKTRSARNQAVVQELRDTINLFREQIQRDQEQTS